MPQIPSNIAQVAAVLVECVLYGIYLVTLAAILQTVAMPCQELTWTSRVKRQWFTLIIVLSLFIISTMNISLGFLRVLAFMRHDVVGSGEVMQLGDDWINIFKPFSVQLQTMIADWVLIYRCWIIYDGSLRIVVFPITLYIGLVTCTVISTIIRASLQDDKTSRVNGEKLWQTWVGFWVSTISTNIYATSMIVIRIWRVESESKGRNTLAPLYNTPHLSRLQTVMKAIIESGLLYTIASVVTFISLVTNSNSMFITSAIEIQATGIAFNLILIRVNQRGRDQTILSRSSTMDFAPRTTRSNNLTTLTFQGAFTERMNADDQVTLDTNSGAEGSEKKHP